MVRVDQRKQQKQPDAAAAHNQRFHTSTKPTPKQMQLNKQISAAANSGDASALSNLIRGNVDHFNSVNCATALHQLAKRASNARDGGGSSGIADEAATSLHALLAARTAAVMSREQADVTPRSLTSIVWAMGLANLVSGCFGGMGGDAMIGVSTINCLNGGRGRFAPTVAAVGVMACTMA